MCIRDSCYDRVRASSSRTVGCVRIAGACCTLVAAVAMLGVVLKPLHHVVPKSTGVSVLGEFGLPAGGVEAALPSFGTRWDDAIDAYSTLEPQAPLLQLNLGRISAASRPRLGRGSAASRLHLGCISAASRLHLGCISAASRLHLGCISAAYRRRPSTSASPFASTCTTTRSRR